MSSKAWDFAGYWNTVLGAHRDAHDVVTEFGLTPDRRGLDEWLGHCEEDARSAGGLAEIPEEWGDFHGRALEALCAATGIVETA